ncbi:major capsid protein [Pseudodesulfovibrio thermohalotolerans]|uniref:major capsid protein n=1 Tax=Pseudodesulfovibrio thermohalotolerans TaxID=2880651 RepID=UPI00244279AC|nr:major capsid protein [Pseudodesulfovibrio thermohalotolerans]WFS63451.1 major capsid protein [Pseudodesulfovibrio thermohalotolerans]
MAVYDNLPAAFDTRAMLETCEVIPPAPGMFKELFFTRRNTHETKKVETEMVRKGKKLFPFVSDVAGGKLVPRRTRGKLTVECPRIRPKDAFTAPDLLSKTAPGEIAYVNNPNALTPEQRVERAIVDQLTEFRDGIERTIEFMCARVATTGKLTVVQPDLSFEIDFLMPSGNKVVLTGDDLWSAASGVAILTQLEGFATDLIGEESGLPADILMCGTNAWKTLFGKQDFRDVLDNRRIDLGHLSPMIGKSYKGNVGNLDIYVNSDKYEDESGTLQPMLHPDYIVLGSSLGDARIEFGVPQELPCPGPMEFFAKSYIQEDPSQLMLVGESNPLPNPRNVGAFAYIKVL